VYNPTVGLIPYTQIDDYGRVSARLAAQVASNKAQLQVDFPAVVRRYANPETALESLFQVSETMDASDGKLGAYVIQVDGEVLGVATFMQQTLVRRRGLQLPFLGRYEEVPGTRNGALLAVWLGRANRPEQVLLPKILGEGMRLLRRSSVTGRAYTLVRPDRPEVTKPLGDAYAVATFGGFRRMLPAMNFSHVDGVRVRRELYVSILDVPDMHHS
jgi:hypothetical protein